MKNITKYQVELKSTIEKFQGSSMPVIIFGASKGGWYILQVLQHFGISVKGFIDNNESVHGTYEGYPVTSPMQYIESNSDAHVVVGLFRESTAQHIASKLNELEFGDINTCLDAFLFGYYEQVVQRNCDMDILANSIYVLFESYKEERSDHYGFTQGGYFVSPFLTSNITQKCSLDCVDCVHLIPFYDSPVNYSVDSVYQDIKHYAKAFDVVPEISISGGEPLMNKQMGEICEAISTIPNIVFVIFITNGTIIPSDKILKSLQISGASLQQSDYQDLSPKKVKVTELCQENNIFTDLVYTVESKMWYQRPEVKQYHRSSQENNTIYNACVSQKICCHIMDGELHRCAHSIHASRLGKIPKMDGDFINLNRDESESQKMVDEIRGFLTRKVALGACDHCISPTVEVKPAIQLKKRVIQIQEV